VAREAKLRPRVLKPRTEAETAQNSKPGNVDADYQQWAY
jgi:hypothetical protein